MGQTGYLSDKVILIFKIHYAFIPLIKGFRCSIINNLYCFAFISKYVFKFFIKT